MATVRVRIRLDLTPACSIGPGKVALLEAIGKAGSLSGAARAIGMSYRRAWLLLEELNAAFREPVTRSAVGGAGGGGVEITDFGHELVTAYRSLESAIDTLAPRHVRGVAARAVPLPAGAPAKVRRPLNRR